jgi:hypothetical protein
MKGNRANLYAIVQRGQNSGICVEPHMYADGKYHVARRKEDRPVRVDLGEIKSYIRRDYGARMGNRLKRHPPGLFMPKSIYGWK